MCLVYSNSEFYNTTARIIILMQVHIYTFHSVFNLGFNFAQAVNFATENWIPYGVKTKKRRRKPRLIGG